MNKDVRRAILITSRYHETSSFVGWRYRFVFEEDQRGGSFAERLLPEYEKLFEVVWNDGVEPQ